MQNMHNIHAELAVQERIHFSVSLGNVKYAQHTRGACSPGAHPLQRQSWEPIWEGSSVDGCQLHDES